MPYRCYGCEQIALHLTGKVTGRFRNTVFAHLDSDLPLVFWWQGDLSGIFSERLASVIDRLIVDSSSWADPAAAFEKIEEASHSNSDLILQDHAWSRTWQFRLGVASIFDDPAAQRAIAEIDRVEITHHPDHRSSALQLLAWLAVQAGWSDGKRESGKAAKNFGFVSPAGIAIEAHLQEDAAAPPVSRLVLRAGSCSAVISQAAGAAHVERRIEPEAETPFRFLQLRRGHAEIEQFRLDPWPVWRFRAGGITIEKSLHLIDAHARIWTPAAEAAAA